MKNSSFFNHVAVCIRSVMWLLFATIFLLCFQNAGHAFDKSLVLYLPFEEGKGDIAHDISGNENHGDINKTEWVKEGKYDSALNFTGAPDSYVRIKRSKSLIPKDQITLEAWVFPTKVEGNNNIICNTESAGHNMRFEGGKLIAYIHVAGGYATPTGGPIITPNKWYHTAVTFDGKTAKLYLDGELIGEVDRKGEITESTQDIFVGSETDGNQPNPTYNFFGIIDEVRIWHVARTQDEIKEGMEKLLPVTPKGNLTTSWGNLKQQI